MQNKHPTKNDNTPKGVAPKHALPDDGSGLYQRRRRAAAAMAQRPLKGQLPGPRKHNEAAIRGAAAGKGGTAFDKARAAQLDKQPHKGGATTRVSRHSRSK